MTALEIAAETVKAREGCKLEAYQDGGGVWTCGWGATGPDITKGTVWTQGTADERLKSDMLNALNAVKRNVKVSLSDKQLAALTSFVFNVGETAFKDSTLLTLLNQKDYFGAVKQLPRWDKDNGQEVRGLLLRRFIEGTLFLQGS